MDSITKLEHQIQDLQKQVAFLQGCCQQLFANDKALDATLGAVEICLLSADASNSSVLGTLNGMPAAITPVTGPVPQTGFALQRFPGSSGF
jgi:hypothetical protein